MNTRTRILQTALHLFNESGTAAISTNHIAEALGISPGNLYYHFRNKEAIIRALFEQQFERWDRMYVFPNDRSPILADLRWLARAAFETNWEYRFIYRELIALLRRDDQLRERWVIVRARGFAGFRELIKQFVAARVLRAPDDDAVVTRLAELIWLVSEFWLASIEARGEPVSAEQIEHGTAMILQVLEPYLLASGQEQPS